MIFSFFSDENLGFCWRRTTNDDEDFFELTENDCEQTRRTLSSNKKKTAEFTRKLSFGDRQFFSSLQNGSTSRKIVKTRKGTDEKCEIRSKSKKNDFDASSSTTPDFIDSLLKYLDERSRRRPLTIISDQKENKNDFS